MTMVNKRAKGTKNEGECLKQFKEYMSKKPEYKYIGEWRSIANRFQNTDVFGDWDILLAYRYKNIQAWFAIQVKSEFKKKYYNYLKNRWRNAPVHCYLAVYGKWANSVRLRETTQRLFTEVIKLEDFKCVRV